MVKLVYTINSRLYHMNELINITITVGPVLGLHSNILHLCERGWSCETFESWNQQLEDVGFGC
jgi:hypothetical protein